jgi:hypothetical protein
VLPTSIFAEMIRLARDETPFPLAMQPRVIALAWRPDNGNVILLDTYEHNGPARDETSHPLGWVLFYYFSLGPFVSYREAFYCLLGDP